MYVADGGLILSPTDLTGFLACGHLTSLDRAAAKDPAGAVPRGDGQQVAAKYGDRHEAAYLERLRSRGLEIVEIPRPGRTPAELREAERATVEAMRAGADVVFQATFFDGQWVGYADFLIRSDVPSPALGEWSYDISDTKLARTAHVSAFVQMASYAAHVERIQGSPPMTLSAVLGSGSESSLPNSQVQPYFRSIRARFMAALEVSGGTYPYPVPHCGLCRWDRDCTTRRVTDDHLSLVAGLRRLQGTRLSGAGLDRLGLLADAADDQIKASGGNQDILERLRLQASLQVAARTVSPPPFEVLPLQPGQGLSALPEPNEGDVFFDLEGDPYIDGGLEYLFGLVEHGPAGPVYREWWAHDHAQERQALSDVADYLTARKRQYPDMHIYHYAHYENSVLDRLSKRASKQGLEALSEKVNVLLRGKILIDLYKIVKNSIVAGVESYSIKKLEPIYGFTRTGEVTNASDSIAEYERWLDSGDTRDEREQLILDQIGDYNRVDCESTLELRDWLLRLRPAGDGASKASPTAGGDAAASSEADATSAALTAYLAHVKATQEQLRDGIPEDESERSEDERVKELLAGLLLWHRQEDAVSWQEFYRRSEFSPEELLEDSTCIGNLIGPTDAGATKQSLLYEFTFPVQDQALRVGDAAVDPATGKAAGTLVSVDPTGRLILSRGKNQPRPEPLALIPGGPPGTGELRDSVLRLGDWVAANALDSPSSEWRAARQILLGRPPKLTGAAAAGAPLVSDGEDFVDACVRLTTSLDHAALAVQGPPGAGKTYTAARVITQLVAQGLRVGVTGPSHKVITGVLDGVTEHAEAIGQPLRVIQKGNKNTSCTHDSVTVVTENKKVVAALDNADVDVVAGTAWLMANASLAGQLDVLFVDEAGQMSLADTLAVSACAASIVLLGDPQQLAQPGAAKHPDGVDVSGLAHILGEHATIPADLGVFLPNTRRMHPDVCAWVSEASYDGRLRSIPGLERQHVAPHTGTPEPLQSLLTGSGLRYVPVVSEGRRNANPDEAAQVAEIVNSLIGGTWTDRDGNTRRIGPEDILVVAPYNAHVAALHVLPDGVRIGTVDKFQGREAPIAIYTMAVSDPEESPRGVGFIYSLNRLNVAISRAQALAVLVCNPALLAPRLAHAEQVPLVSALCSLVETAGATSGR